MLNSASPICFGSELQGRLINGRLSFPSPKKSSKSLLTGYAGVLLDVRTSKWKRGEKHTGRGLSQIQPTPMGRDSSELSPSCLNYTSLTVTS